MKPSVTNLWLQADGDTARAWRNPAIAASGLLETFLVVANEGAAEIDFDSFTESEADEDWNALIDTVLAERIVGDQCEHQLSEPAVQRFLEFHAQTVRHQTANTRKFVAWWPEQLLKITLLLHADTWKQEVPQEIGLATLEDAITLMDRLGAAQLRASEDAGSCEDNLDAQIEIMTAKIRINGPMPKWNLFRRYHVQRAEVMEPILARCCERNLLRIEDDMVQLADAGQ